MKNFNMKGLLVILSLMLFSGKAMAVRAPLDSQGHALATTGFVGAFPCTINGSNSAVTGAPIVCTQGSTMTPTASIVYGVIASSISQTAFLILRDTTPAAATPLVSLGASTVAVVYNVTTSSLAAGAFTTGTNVITFPVPLQFKNGISVNVDSAFSGPVASWTILYRPLDSSTVGN